MQKKWMMLNKNSASEFLGDFDAPNFIKSILVNRGIKTKEEAEKFFHPDYETGGYDPLLILNMETAAKRVIAAIKNKEKIIVFGDYDTDGICGAAILYLFFKKIKYENFETYIPDRNKDEHGMSEKLIEEFFKNGVKLIITVDCGVSDYNETKKARQLGIDVIITDHHIPPNKLPPAYAIIDLFQKNEKYPFKELCGAAVAFKLVSAILKIDSFGAVNGWEKWLLDLVAIATVADMVPLLDENRVLTSYGLKVLKKTMNLGLKLLNQSLKLSPDHISSEDIAFSISPRLNAASRMDHAATSFYLLTTKLKSEAEWLVKRLEETNNERKKMVEETVREFKKIYENQDVLPDFLINGSEKWHPGTLSLASTRIIEEYDKPVCIWGKGPENLIKGSCRSNGKIDLVELLNNVEDGVFFDFGGHPMAAGFTLANNKKEILGKALEKAFFKTSKKNVEENILAIDYALSLDDVNLENYEWLEKFEPFGMKNPNPIFLFNGLKIETVRTFGNGGMHLELTFKNSGGEIINTIGFFMVNQRLRDSESRIRLKSGDTIDLCASLDRNYYNGYDKLRLKIIDFKLKNSNG